MAISGDSRPAIVKWPPGILPDARTMSDAWAEPGFLGLGARDKLHRMKGRTCRAPAGATMTSSAFQLKHDQALCLLSSSRSADAPGGTILQRFNKDMARAGDSRDLALQRKGEKQWNCKTGSR
jgi:hypothetical protein